MKAHNALLSITGQDQVAVQAVEPMTVKGEGVLPVRAAQFGIRIPRRTLGWARRSFSFIFP